MQIRSAGMPLDAKISHILTHKYQHHHKYHGYLRQSLSNDLYEHYH
jgi:hypothetical protein